MNLTAELGEHWIAGDFEACKIIAARMGGNHVVALTTKALGACCSAVRNTPKEVMDVVFVGQTEASWRDGHRDFDAVRVLTLEAERRGPQFDGDFAKARILGLESGTGSQIAEHMLDELPAYFIPVLDNGVGDYYGFIAEGGVCRQTVSFWDHETGEVLDGQFNDFFEKVVALAFGETGSKAT